MTPPGEEKTLRWRSESPHSTLQLHLPGEALVHRYAGMPAPREVNVQEQRLRRADDFIRAHLESPLTLQAIAEVLGLSRFHTLRLFKSAYGETPIKRLTRLRMERARLLLARNGESVTEVAFRCGYDNPAHFANAFRRFTGMTPTEFRRRGGRSQ